MKPRFIYIDKEGRAYINGKKDYPLELPSTYNHSDYERAFLQACVDYGFDIPDDDAEIERMLTPAVRQHVKRIENKQREDTQQQQPKEGGGQGEAEITPADALYNLVKSECVETFRDEERRTPYAIINHEGTIEMLDMESTAFKHKLRVMYYDHIQSENMQNNSAKTPIINETELNKAIEQLQASITQTRALYTRCYFDGKALYYDLCDKEGQYVLVDNGRFTIEKGAYKYFRPAESNREQVAPVPGNGKELLDALIKSFNLVDNKEGDKAHLLQVYIIGLFVNPAKKLTMPILSVNGPEGASKTTLCITIKYHIDPINGNPKAMANRWGVQDQSRDRGLVVAKNYYTVWDNISYLSNNDSDELCTYATGVRWQERKLHTNMDTIEYTLQGNVAYTSINDVARQGDLISRQLQFDLQMRTVNIPESVFWEQREKEKPAILAYIFETLAKAIPIYNELRQDRKEEIGHRFADMRLLYQAISAAMGEPADRMKRIFKALDREQTQRVMSNSNFNEFFKSFCMSYLMAAAKPLADRKDVYEITVSSKALHNWLIDYAQKEEPNVVKSDDWPTNSGALGKRLARLRKPLAAMGVVISEPVHKATGNEYIIMIEQSAEDN